MPLILAAIVILLVGGAGSFLAGGSPRAAIRLGRGAVHAACLVATLGLVFAWEGRLPMDLHPPWAVPFGSFSVALDPLTSWFLLPLLPLAALAASYGAANMEHDHEGPAGGHSAGTSWFYFDLLVASLLLVLIARNGILFLVAWEVMALSSFFLVTWDDDRREVRDAGWIYLVATH